MGNSIKFTTSGKITLEVNQLSQQELEFVFQDTGRGISKNKLPYIFESFEQDTRENESTKGTGLGLTITRKLVNKMNGRINVESDVNQGTRFSVFIPLEKVDEKTVVDINSRKNSTSDLELAGTKILVVDDTKMNITLLENIHVKHNCLVTSKENGKLALQEYQNDPSQFNIIIMDIQMPVMDSLTAIKEIREFEERNSLSPVPIIAFSAFAFEEDFQNSLEAGANFHLAKPVKQKDLIKTIYSALDLENKQVREA